MATAPPVDLWLFDKLSNGNCTAAMVAALPPAVRLSQRQARFWRRAACVPGGARYGIISASHPPRTHRVSVIMSVKDSNGTPLEEGDSVHVIKDLKVKGASLTLKRGKVFKSIHLTDNEEEVECREGKSTLVLKTCFLKKA
jgi:protein PhnA